MKNKQHIPTILDFAYDVIAMHEEIRHLRERLEHYKKLDEINRESMYHSRENNKEFLGIMLEAAFDPDSVVNKGHEAILKEQFNKKKNNA